MKRMIRNNIFFFILGALIFGGISVVFAYTMVASKVDYRPLNENWDVNNVNDALDDLYSINKDNSTIRFNANGGSSLVSFVKIKKGEKLWSLPTATRSEYVFGGWYTDTNYTTKVTADNLDTNTDKTLYAKWIYGTLISSIPSSQYTSYYGKTVNYNGDSNWIILYIGSDFSTDGVHMYLISKTARSNGKPTASGSYANTVLNTAAGKKLLSWADSYSSSNGNSNGASKTWNMLTASNNTTYCDSSVCAFAIGGPTIDLYFKAYNQKVGTSFNLKNYNSTGYVYNNFTGLTNTFGLGTTSFWFASPGSYGNGWVMTLSGDKTWCLADKDSAQNFLPVVSIKTNGVIYSNGTNYSITTT